jgi:hypothetical protein
MVHNRSMPAARRGHADGAVTTPCLLVVARTSPADQPMRCEEAAGVRTSDAQATRRAWSQGCVLTEATWWYGGDEDGGATVNSRRRAVVDGQRWLRCAPAPRSEERGGE